MKSRLVTKVLTDEQDNLIGGGLVKMEIVNEVEGEELENILTYGVNKSIQMLKSSISQYERTRLFQIWLSFVRQIEEFINIRYEYGSSYENVLKKVHLDSESQMKIIGDDIENTFGVVVATHFRELSKLFIDYSAEINGGEIKVKPIITLYDLWVFLQGSRLHIMTILNLIPLYACGEMSFRCEDIPSKMNEWIGYLMNITIGCQAIIETRCLPTFHAKVTSKGLEFSHQYTHLDNNFLEPQMLTDVELEQYRGERLGTRETKKEPSICSKEELELILQNEVAYRKRYGITEKEEYKELMAFMYEMMQYFKDDYAIEVQQKEFDRLRGAYGELELYKEMTDFDDIENSRYGFVKIDGVYYSTYFMLLRYYLNSVLRMLTRRRRYQIDAGFVFEDQVKTIVRKYGFEVRDDCKRIQRKEFDVVCVKDGTIYNFQCKNNFIKVSVLGLKETTAICRRNKQLISYYKAALRKEEGREHLLKEKLGIDRVKHYVISRYPVITDNDRIIPFNKFEEWCKHS